MPWGLCLPKGSKAPYTVAIPPRTRLRMQGVAWIDRLTFAAIGIVGLLSSGLLLLAAAVVGNSDADFQSTLQVFGFFGIVVTAVIQMRVVAQLLRRESDDTYGRRV